MESFYRMITSVRDQLTPVLSSSRFAENGTLTPDEFVTAGDFLVYKCPTWSPITFTQLTARKWCAGESSKARSYLPKDKQYLITRNVPCQKRVSDMENGLDERMVDGEEEWVEAQSNQQRDEVIQDIDDEIIPDIDNEAAVDLITTLLTRKLEDPSVVASHTTTQTAILLTRYDKYYQCPHVHLLGYDEHNRPLTPQQTFQDISQDHAQKTVTIEEHPHESLSMASIHPCKHAAVMKTITDRMSARAGSVLRVDLYMLIFLKFLSAVLPTMEYDYTSSMEV